MTQLPALAAPDFSTEIARLARDYRKANGPVMSLMNRLAGGIEKYVESLPPKVRGEVERFTQRGLEMAFGAGSFAPDLGRRGTMAAAVASGAAGGAGGVLTSVAELPVTITVILAAIQGEARAAGFDPAEPVVRAACLQVFAAGSPLMDDEGVNSAFLSARLTMTGPALQRLIVRVAPRLATAMGQKLAAQAVPVLGAMTGAALNAAYLRYYREMARIRFALMRLSVRHGAEAVVAAFADAARPPKITKA